MTENSKKVLEYLQDNSGDSFTKQEIAANLSIPIQAVVGSTTGHKKKGLISEEEKTETNENGKELVKKYVTITEEGMNFDPEATEKK